ncbi:MAG: hypothetical protein ABI925_03360 [Verrucomicrobiota bacterium]
MRKLTLGLLAFVAAMPAAFSGETSSYSGKEMRTTTAPAPVCEWYRDTEWNVGLWGAYAFTDTENNRTTLRDVFLTTEMGRYDRFLGGDHAWGGGLDIKYFFARYFGVGIEGFGLAAHGSRYNITNFGTGGGEFDKASDRHFVPGALGTLTLRFPIGCSRFAPYTWAGGGGIFNGHRDRPIHSTGDVMQIAHETESRAMGQFGGGMEVRLTPHVGWIADFSWNVVDGPNNNFGMARSGINVSF